MTFKENWFGPASCVALDKLAKSVLRVSGEIIEVGSWEGRSTCVLANAVWPLNVHAVDTWAGSPSEISEFLASRRDVFADFQRNVVTYTRGNVFPHRMGWREFFDGYTDRVKFCFIDAEHTYDEVKDNIETVLPLMVPGGVICGDDVHHPPVQQAVIDVLGDAVFVDASLWYWRAP
jgi:hypothetical protein